MEDKSVSYIVHGSGRNNERAEETVYLRYFRSFYVAVHNP